MFLNLILTGISLSQLPMILLWVLIIVLFLVILWFILSKAPAPIAEWAKVIVIVVGGSSIISK